MIVYLVVSLFVCFLATMAQKKDKFSYVFVIIVCISLFSGLRGATVGSDTDNYFVYFRRIISSYGSLLEIGLHSYEIGFSSIVKITWMITHNYQCIMLVFSFLTNYLIIKRIWDYKELNSFTYMVFLYLMLCFPASLNIMRQYLAIAILFYFSRYLGKKRGTFIFLVAVILASMVHTSALIGIIFIVLYSMAYNNLSIKSIVISIFCLIIVIVFSSVLSSYLDKYSVESTLVTHSIGAGTLLRLPPLIFFVLLLFRRKLYDRDEVSYENTKYITFLYSVGVILSIFGSFYYQANRIGMYNLIFEIPFIGMICRNNRYRQLYTLYYFIFALFMFISKTYLNGEGGIFPYVFFFD